VSDESAVKANGEAGGQATAPPSADEGGVEKAATVDSAASKADTETPDNTATKDEAPRLPPLAPVIASLRAELLSKDEQLKSYITAYKQASADMERERARLERDRERTGERDRMNMASSLLDVLDNFGRSLESCRAGGSDKDLLTGLELVHSQFLVALEELGVERMSALGETFDPASHEATGMVPASGDQADQEIIFEERPGYTFKGQLLRPARVVVASRPE
jgi:molecular chaperone GrpE